MFANSRSLHSNYCSSVFCTGPRSTEASPVEYEYYYEDDYEDEPAAAPAVKAADAAVKDKSKDSNYDIEDLVKAWREYLKEKKNGEFLFLDCK